MTPSTAALIKPIIIQIAFLFILFQHIKNYRSLNLPVFATGQGLLMVEIDPDDVVDELGSRSIIEKVPELMQKGTGADRQMAVFNQEKNMAQVVDYIGSQFLQGI
jgi:hypothetical protein